MNTSLVLPAYFQPSGKSSSWAKRIEHLIPWGMEWIYGEGRRLYEEGRVVDLVREESGDITATVLDGGEAHTVCVSFLPPPLYGGKKHCFPSFLGDMALYCSCLEGRSMCQHVVAVLLASGGRE